MVDRITLVSAPTSVRLGQPLHFDVDISQCSTISLLGGYSLTFPSSALGGMSLTFKLLGRVFDFPEVIVLNRVISDYQFDPTDGRAFFVQEGGWSSVGVHSLSLDVTADTVFNPPSGLTFSVNHLAVDCAH